MMKKIKINKLKKKNKFKVNMLQAMCQIPKYNL